MQLVIVCIIVFLVYRYFQKKKAEKNSLKSRQLSIMDVQYYPVNRPQLRGTPVAETDLPKKWDDLRTGSDWGWIDGKQVNNPDFEFACTKKIYDTCLKDIRRIGASVSEDSEAYCFIVYGVKLAQYYRDGFGCDLNPQAAIDVIQNVLKFWEIESMFVKRSRFQPDEMKIIHDLVLHINEALLCEADCGVMVHNMEMAEFRYRQCFKGASDFGNPAYVKSEIVKHAMGDYNIDYPRPICLHTAFELALSMAGEGDALGGHYLRSLIDLRKLDWNSLGHSWEQDFTIYSQDDSVYAAYRVGLAKLYGLGTERDVKSGLELLEAAYNCDSVQAAYAIYEYYLHLSCLCLDKEAKKQITQLEDRWSTRYERLRVNTKVLMQIKSTDSINEKLSEYSNKYESSQKSFEDSNEGYDNAVASKTSASNGNDTDEYGSGTNEFDLYNLPNIIYDDNNKRWQLQHRNGDTVVYHDDDGQEVTIYNGQISGSGATTSAGNFHWY